MKNNNRYRDDANRYYDDDWYSRYNDLNDYDYNTRPDYNNYQQGDKENQYNDSYSRNRNYRDNRFYNPEYSRPYRQNDYYENNNRNYRDENHLNRNRRDNDYNRNERSWWNKATDEVSSWFGDDDAERRRRMDDIREYNHRGKGPKNYKRSPERIKDDVNDKLSDHWMIDASDIEVEVKGSEVILNGTVDSRESKRRSEDVAESVSGVTNVQNNLRIKNASDTYNTNTKFNPAVSNSSYSNGSHKKESSSHN